MKRGERENTILGMVGEVNFNWLALKTHDRAPAHTVGITELHVTKEKGEKKRKSSILHSTPVS